MPLLLAHRWRDWPGLRDAAAAAVAFCLASSSAYLVNDTLDRAVDRLHPTKRHRPIASGALSARHALIAAGILLLAGGGIAAVSDVLLGACLALYYALAVGYSAWIKRIPVLDVILLAALYTLRVLAGGAASSITPSFWLLAFSLFIFLSLALVKRYAELDAAAPEAGQTLAGRGYGREDAALLLGLGPPAGFVAVLVLALYINSPESLVLYRRPQVLWLVCPLLLYWITRVWFLTARGRMHEDPVVFAATDWVSMVVAALAAMAVVIAT
jgi:4-hydroxybenzoate polyprenyltransferase